jgi:hypothetical protein
MPEISQQKNVFAELLGDVNSIQSPSGHRFAQPRSYGTSFLHVPVEITDTVPSPLLVT